MSWRKVDGCSTMKDRNGRLTLGGDEVRRVWKDYFDDLYNIGTQKQVAVYMCGFDCFQRGNYFEGELITESGKFKN